MSLFWTKTYFFFHNYFPSARNILPMIMTKTEKTELLQESPHENIWQRTKKWELDYKSKLGINFYYKFLESLKIYILTNNPKRQTLKLN